MTDGGDAQDVYYEYQSMKVIRGREASAIAEQKAAGWELDRQNKGTLRTELTFRRETDPPRPFSWKLIGGIAAFVVVGIAIFAILAALGVGDDDSDEAKDEPAATTTTASREPSDTPTETPSEEPSTPSEEPSETEVSEPPIDGVLTIQNNADLRALLNADDDYSLNQAFAKNYKGREIQFNGSVADATPGYYLVYFGDDSDTNATSGPAFQFRVQSLQADGRPVDTGDNLRFTAVVGAFNADQGLFFLTPVKITAR